MSREQERAEKKLLLDAVNPRFEAMLAHSVAYGQIAVRSSFLLNGGILFVLPTYVAAIGGVDSEDSRICLIASASFFVFGIICSALVCFSAFLNFQWNIDSLEAERAQALAEIEELFDDTGNKEKSNEREKIYHESISMRENNVRKTRVSFVISMALTAASYACFVVGCALAGLAILPDQKL